MEYSSCWIVNRNQQNNLRLNTTKIPFFIINIPIAKTHQLKIWELSFGAPIRANATTSRQVHVIIFQRWPVDFAIRLSLAHRHNSYQLLYAHGLATFLHL